MSKKFYITTPMYYVNDVAHLGHAYSTIIADTVARYHRFVGNDVFLLTGTDEHGQKIENKAAELGKDTRAFCDEISAKFKSDWDMMGITYDGFIRTTDKVHAQTVKEFFEAVHAKGDIYKAKYGGYYCVGCERFYPEKELIELNGVKNVCPDHKKPANWMEEENYFFKLSKYTEQIREALVKNQIVLPENRLNEVLAILDEGLEDISISRANLKWGIPVPNDPTQVIYVWFDALISYISGLNKSGKPDYFPANVHIVGKEIVRFHAIIWIGMLLSRGLPLPEHILGHGWLTVNGEKMSKSLGNVLSPAQLTEELTNDGLRYYLLREVSFTRDGDYSKDIAYLRLNADLANNIGNLANRTISMTHKYFNGVVPEGELDNNMKDVITQTLSQVGSFMDKYHCNEALQAIVDLSDRLNKYVDSSAPWTLAKNNDPQLHNVIYTALEGVRIIGLLLSSFTPGISLKILHQLGYNVDEKMVVGFVDLLAKICPGQKLNQAQPVFVRLGEELADKSSKKKK